MPRPLAPLALLALLAGCAGDALPPPPPPPPPPQAAAPTGWRAEATRDDAARLARLGPAWATALAQARRAGHGGELSGLGPLADPAAALPDPTPPPGAYRCRTIKLGSPRAHDGLTYVAYPFFRCRVEREGDLLRLVKLTGSQRQAGRILPNGPRRDVFLGTLALADEQSWPAYGADPTRDIVGAVERFAPARWRLVMPFPRHESLLDLLELVPA